MSPVLSGRAAKLSTAKIAAVFASLFFLLLLPLIGAVYIGGSSEARETTVAASIIRTGEWLYPLRLGTVPSKPPLFHWLTALIAPDQQNISPFWPRLISILFASLTIGAAGLTAGIERRAKNHGSGSGAALLAMFILATSYGFIQLAMDARVDMTFSFFASTAAFFILVRGESGPSYKNSIAAGGAAGLAVLTKGPLGLAIPLFALCADWAGRRGREVSVRRALTRAAVFSITAIIIALPWYLGAANHYGSEFISRQIFFENISRFSGVEGTNSRPWWYLLPTFMRTAAPWSILFFLYSFNCWRRLKERDFIYWLFVAACFVFFCLADGKRNSYMIPLFPAMAVCLSLYITDLLDALGGAARLRAEAAARTFLRAVGGIAVFAALLGLSLAADPIYSSFPEILQARSWARRELVLIEAALVVCGLSLIIISTRPLIFRTRELLLSAVLCGAVLAGVVSFGLGFKYALTRFKPLAQIILEKVPKDCPVFVVKRHEDELFDPLIYYLGLEVFEISPDMESFQGGVYLARLPWFEGKRKVLEGIDGFSMIGEFSSPKRGTPGQSIFTAFSLGCQKVMSLEG